MEIFLNLFINAVDAMPEGGKLQVEGLVERPDHKKEDFLAIRVSDTGVGIKRENLSKIFDPFYTTREDGVGLGLSLCHQIISDHNGNMQIESKEKVGTKVFLTFPISNN